MIHSKQFSLRYSENRTGVLTAAAPLFSLYIGAQHMGLPDRKNYAGMISSPEQPHD